MKFIQNYTFTVIALTIYDQYQQQSTTDQHFDGNWKLDTLLNQLSGDKDTIIYFGSSNHVLQLLALDICQYC